MRKIQPRFFRGYALVVVYIGKLFQEALYDFFFSFFSCKSERAELQYLFAGDFADCSLMDKLSVNICGVKRRLSVNLAVICKNRIARRVTCTTIVAFYYRIEG